MGGGPSQVGRTGAAKDAEGAPRGRGGTFHPSVEADWNGGRLRTHGGRQATLRIEQAGRTIFVSAVRVPAPGRYSLRPRGEYLRGLLRPARRLAVGPAPSGPCHLPLPH